MQYILFYSFLVILAIIGLVVVIFQVLQLYYLINPSKVFLAHSSLERINPLLKSIINKNVQNINDVIFYELGSGKGSISRFVYQTFAFKQVIGVEGDWMTYKYALLLQLISKTKVKFINNDIFKLKYEPHSVLYCYLFSNIMDKMYKEGYFDGKLVISLSFKISGVEPSEIYELNNFQKQLLVYDFRDKK
jgi:hypothetical protein